MVLIYGQGYPPRLMLSIVIDALGASPLLNYHSPAWKIAKRLKSNHLARPIRSASCDYIFRFREETEAREGRISRVLLN